MAPYPLVGASQRAGTSLLQSVLSGDRQTKPVIRDAAPLRAMVETYRPGRQTLATAGQEYFDGEAEPRAMAAGRVRGFLEQTRARYAPPTRLVLKEPHLTMPFPALDELLRDDARFLVIVRDPRDTIASMVRVGERLAAEGRPDNPFPRHNMAKRAGLYKAFHAPCVNARDPAFRKRLLVLKYERLVEAPHEVLARRRAFAGLSLAGFEPTAPWQSRIDYAEPAPYGHPCLTGLTGKGVSPASVGAPPRDPPVERDRGHRARMCRRLPCRRPPPLSRRRRAGARGASVDDFLTRLARY